MFLNILGLYFVFLYLGTFAHDQSGITESIYPLMVLNGVGVFGRALLPIIADKWVGLLNLLKQTSFSASLLVYCWTVIHSIGGPFAFAVVNGFLAAALQALFPAVATIVPHPNRKDTGVGIILGFVGFSNLTGPAICGALIRKEDRSYLGAQMFAASVILLGAIMELVARIAKSGILLGAKV